jgi:hypothetical protein
VPCSKSFDAKNILLRILAKVLLIAPEHSLGTLWSGTLNFRRSMARSLLPLGWSDARRCLGYPECLPESLPLRGTTARQPLR